MICQRGVSGCGKPAGSVTLADTCDLMWRSFGGNGTERTERNMGLFVSEQMLTTLSSLLATKDEESIPLSKRTTEDNKNGYDSPRALLFTVRHKRVSLNELSSC